MKTMQTRIVLFIGVGLLITIIGIFLHNKSSLDRSNNTQDKPSNHIASTSNELEYLIGKDFDGVNEIIFRYKFPSKDQYAYDLKHIQTSNNKEFHNKLFGKYLYMREGEGHIGITNIPIQNRPSDLYFITRSVFHRDGYRIRYFAVYNPRIGRVVYESHGMFNTIMEYGDARLLPNGDIVMSILYPHYFDFGMGSSYEIVEYIGYDEKTERYVTKNTQYKDTFEELLTSLQKNNKCAVEEGGEPITFQEIKQRYGEDYECKSSESDLPIYGGKGITPKEFFLLSNRLTLIIQGNENSLLNDTF